MRSVHTAVHTEDLLGWSEESERADAEAQSILARVIAEACEDPAERELFLRAQRECIALERTRKATLRAKLKQADDGTAPILVDYAGAANLLGTTASALKTRVSRGDPKLVAARVMHGRAVRFNVAKLTERHTPGRRS